MFSFVFRLKRKLRITVFNLLYKRDFRAFGSHSYIYRPIRLTPGFISIGNKVQVNDFARIEGLDRYNDKSFQPKIILHDHVSIQQGLHLTCAKSIEIGSHTAIAANVSITDINHPYADVSIAPEYQDIEVDEVIIGEDCKIYNNAVILPGVRLGRHTVVAANAVVMKGDYGDYVILGGAPAKVLKRYDFEKRQWTKV
ncbi:MAG TPA: acyltransferase [Flavisolibacter sp.]|nr:acyltransferase [Flavisolibacter sp.]